MNIVMIAINDPAGTAIGFAEGLNRHTDHFCRVVTLETRYNHGWKQDLHVPDLDESGLAELEETLASADVFHFHMTADEHLKLGPFTPADYLHGKAVVHHHHGHPDFRSHPGKYSRKYSRLKRRNLLVSTPDLLHILPEAAWQPNCVNERAARYAPCESDKPLPVRLAHSPTRKDLKNTDDLMLVMRELWSEGIEIELDIIDDSPHNDCLERKNRCHMQFDHMQGYYGMSSLEGLAQGLPTLAGLDDWCSGHMKDFADTQSLPWLTPRTPEQLAATLRLLNSDHDLRRAKGRESRAFMETAWSEKRVINRLNNFYSTLR